MNRQEGLQLGQDLTMATSVWFNMRDAVVNSIEENLNKVTEVCNDTRRSRVAGATVSIAGGGLAIIGLALLPLTFGASLALSAVGAVLGVGGGLTSLGAIISKTAIPKAKLKKLKESIEVAAEVEKQLCNQINQIEDRLVKITEELHEENPTMSKQEILLSFVQGGKVARVGVLTVRFGVTGAQVSRFGSAALRGGLFGLRFGGAAVRGTIALVGGAISILILPLDIFELVQNARKLHRKSQSVVERPFCELLQQIQRQSSEDEEPSSSSQ